MPQLHDAVHQLLPGGASCACANGTAAAGAHLVERHEQPRRDGPVYLGQVCLEPLVLRAAMVQTQQLSSTQDALYTPTLPWAGMQLVVLPAHCVPLDASLGVVKVGVQVARGSVARQLMV
jgi:hypothetical protein